MTMLVRFAPSPTGLLHVGNLRTALMNYLFVKAQGGQFMLRIDDTDRERSRDEYEAGIKNELAWMGIAIDRFEKQSLRFDRYELAKQKLIEAGRLYACYETAEELDVKRKMLASRGLPPMYDRAGLKLTDGEKQQFEAEGRKPHWRFLMNHAPIQWQDLIRGAVSFDGANIADPVLFREDGVALFTLSTSVDDGEHGITHILRGEDHVTNTAVQVQVMEALGYAPPVFGHMALLKMKEGKISKRSGGGDVEGLREAGILPMVLASYLAKLGTSDAIDLYPSLDALIKSFAIEKLGRAMANYDPAELERLNEKYWRNVSYEQMQTLLPDDWQRERVTKEIWAVIQSDVKSKADISNWLTIIYGGVVTNLAYSDAEYLEQISNFIPEDLNHNSWNEFIEKTKQETGRKGKELFMPIRNVLTADVHGPELDRLFYILGKVRGRDEIINRLCASAKFKREYGNESPTSA
jgi:glutamyl-tRNA synthetase